MKPSDIEALMRGIAPVVRDLVAAAVAPVIARNAELERQIETLLARPIVTIDAIRGDVEQIAAQAVAEAVSTLPPGATGERGEPGAPGVNGKDGADGKSVTLDDVAPLIETAVSEYLAAHPAPAGRDGIDGKDGAKGDAGSDGRDGRDGVDGSPGRDGIDGKDGAPGRLPLVRAWAAGVSYEAEVRTHDGSLWQALRDTGQEPGGDDWICLAARGHDGADAMQIDVVGTYEPARAGEYRRLNVVALNGATFIARMDAPGACPGDGWQLMSVQGRRGAPGERGEKGDPGPRGAPGPGVAALGVNGEGLFTLVNADGTELSCDFYDVLAKR